jgi:serine/threonine protein kinase/tetratricopeptide (TPR) repeat protein
MPLPTGTRLGNYEILSPLGSGGMGEVYRARDVRLGRSVAVKALPEAFASDPERMARFEREARALAAVQHPNIAVLYGMEEANGVSFLALELVEGESLSQRLGRGPLTVSETLELGAQIASAIDAAHERGIVHRDLKPSNIMLSPSGSAKVLDFGLAKGGPLLADSDPGLSANPTVAFGSTAAGLVIGTAAYMSPEQARGRPVDRRADVWALGCILFECLSGRQVFEGDTTSDVLARVLEREPDWDVLPAAIPARLRDVLRRCLTKSPADRPRDAGDLRGELVAIAADRSSSSRIMAASATPSLAVLYFQNHSSDPDSDYFCDGITEDIMTDLSKVKGLRVASRSAVMRYRGTEADAGRVASDLGVRAVLEGSVRRSGARIRLTVQLVSADGFQIWGERFDRTLEDVFEVQDEVAAAIASALKVALAPGERERLVEDRPRGFEAYDFYLKGRELYGKYAVESLHEAIRMFERAIEIDPSYALAYAGIGDAYGQLLQWTDESPEELGRRGLEAARRAIELNPRLPEGHKAEALVLGQVGDQEGQLNALRRALEVDPRFTPALDNLGVEWFRCGDLAGAERAVRRSLEIVPDDPHTLYWLATLTRSTGRIEEAEGILDRILGLSNAVFYRTTAHTQRALLLASTRGVGELARHVERVRDDGVDSANLAMLESYLSARSGRAEEAKRLFREFGNSTALDIEALGFGALAAWHVGENERATALLQRRVIHSIAPVMLRLEPLLHPLLDLEPFAPRRSPLGLVWPLEAPMIDRARFQLFTGVRIQSGRPEGSDILATG